MRSIASARLTGSSHAASSRIVDTRPVIPWPLVTLIGIDLPCAAFPVNLGIVVTFGENESNQAPLQSRQGVIDQDVPPRHFHLELNDGRATRRHYGCLHVGQDG